MSDLTRDQKIEKIRTKVESYLMKNAEFCGVPVTSLFVDESKNHIINIGTDIMANRLGIETYPGSFIKAILENNLYEAINRSDSINRGAITFYVTMMHNLGIDLSE
jgi:tRNA A-37 threonylcarbamoyl transferase component Bud32